MKFEKTETLASKVLADIEHTNLATFSLNEVELVSIDGENFFAKGLSCYSFAVTLNGRDVIINSYCDSELKKINTGDLWLFFNTRKVLLYDNTHQELLGEITKVLDPRNQRERVKDLEL